MKPPTHKVKVRVLKKADAEQYKILALFANYMLKGQWERGDWIDGIRKVYPINR